MQRQETIIVIEGDLTLRVSEAAIVCELTDPDPTSHRCAEEYRVMVENAARRLEASGALARIPDRPRRWRVVDAAGEAVVEESWLN